MGDKTFFNRNYPESSVLTVPELAHMIGWEFQNHNPYNFLGIIPYVPASPSHTFGMTLLWLDDLEHHPNKDKLEDKTLRHHDGQFEIVDSHDIRLSSIESKTYDYLGQSRNSLESIGTYDVRSLPSLDPKGIHDTGLHYKKGGFDFEIYGEHSVNVDVALREFALYLLDERIEHNNVIRPENVFFYVMSYNMADARVHHCQEKWLEGLDKAVASAESWEKLMKERIGYIEDDSRRMLRPTKVRMMEQYLVIRQVDSLKMLPESLWSEITLAEMKSMLPKQPRYERMEESARNF